MLPTSTRTRRSSRPSRRLGVATLFVSLAFTGSAVVLTPPGAAVASMPSVITNELADDISTTSEAALAALDAFEATGSAEALAEFTSERTRTARFVAREIDADEFTMIRAWASASLERQRVVLAALTQVGVPYRRYGAVPGEGFDCSGLTGYAWAAADVELPRSSGEQINAAERRSIDEAELGDLLQYPGHVMLYLGVDDAVVHAVRTGRSVEVDRVSSKRFGSVRVGSPLG